MKPLLWLALGGAAAVAAALVFGRKKERALAAPEPTPAPTYGETERVLLVLPAGWRRVTSAEVAALPELRARANALLNTPGFSTMYYGTIAPFTASDGKTYATWIEQHYHEPNGPLWPWGLHHGVTLLAKEEARRA